MVSEETLDLKKSKYNAAFAQLFRLDKLWQDSQRHSRGRQYLAWNLDLDAIWRELSEDIKPGGVDEVDFRKFNEKLGSLGLFSLQSKNGFDRSQTTIQINGESINQIAIIYKLLDLKETFLRRLQNKQGKSAVYEDNIEDYMD